MILAGMLDGMLDGMPAKDLWKKYNKINGRWCGPPVPDPVGGRLRLRWGLRQRASPARPRGAAGERRAMGLFASDMPVRRSRADCVAGSGGR